MTDGLRITHVISYASGWEILSQRPEVLRDIKGVLEGITLDDLLSYAQYGEIVGSSYVQLWKSRLGLLGWGDRRVSSRRAGGLNLVLRTVKNGVSARFLHNEPLHGTAFANWLMVEAPKAYELGLCDLSVLCVLVGGSSSLVDKRRRAVNNVITIHGCWAQIKDLLPLRSPAPFVVLGVSIADRPLEIHEIAVDPIAVAERGAAIEKSIEFPQEYYQAGVSILSYFGEVLKQKHPDVRAKVRIEQDGLTVRMHIESATGDREIIEKTLEEYGLVVAEKLPPEALFESRLQIVALEQKLELARMEVRHTHQLLALANAGARELQDEVHYLRAHIGRQLAQTDTVHTLLARQCEANEKLLLAHVSQADTLIKDLIRQAADNRAVAEALATIDEKLTAGMTAADEESVNRALAVIHREKPTIFTHLQSAALNLSYEVSGSYLFKWIEAFAARV